MFAGYFPLQLWKLLPMLPIQICGIHSSGIRIEWIISSWSCEALCEVVRIMQLEIQLLSCLPIPFPIAHNSNSFWPQFSTLDLSPKVIMLDVWVKSVGLFLNDSSVKKHCHMLWPNINKQREDLEPFFFSVEATEESFSSLFSLMQKFRMGNFVTQCKEAASQPSLVSLIFPWF